MGTYEQYGFYQDRHTRSSILVKCIKDVCKPLGSFTVGGKQYLLDLAHRAVESKSLLTPVERPPDMKISMEGDMVFFTPDSITPAVQKQTNDSDPIKSDLTVIPGSKTTSQQPSIKTASKTRYKDRSKRGIPSKTDIVEIMVYADEVMCKRFFNLKNSDKTAGLEATRFFYALLVNEMDQVYQGFQDHPSNTARLAIRLLFSGILIACDSAGAPWSTNRTNASSDLSDFAKWQKNMKSKLNLKYDIAMGISGKIKGSGSTMTLGIGYTHAICNEQFGANIVYDTKFSTWLMTTSVHELGHNLGASHDQSQGCSGGHVMSVNQYTANASTATTQFEFTSCAVGAIKRIITKLGSSRCTLKHDFNDTQYDQYRAGAIGGDVLNLDFQCQAYYGSGSFACLKNNNTMCYRGVTCQSSSGCKGRLQLVKEHTECDTNKWCSKGKCVDKSTSGKDIPGTCFVHKICTLIKNLPIGDGCCQGLRNTSCCTLDKKQTSCSVKVPC
ncbi:hypothetical protein CHS0354_041216 [Potamilus streckersoni]|uniref:Peptidase M12B domain-containing protein n=1 Tax=Potamilus streckersoni TaxID=2493646 RepID=A0AAE0VUZ0_9BIVA|nr:hypothetical protein CHS0354_041216 [Potamilus streckersoni]